MKKYPFHFYKDGDVYCPSNSSKTGTPDKLRNLFCFSLENGKKIFGLILKRFIKTAHGGNPGLWFKMVFGKLTDLLFMNHLKLFHTVIHLFLQN